jgi:hypothetical protein
MRLFSQVRLISNLKFENPQIGVPYENRTRAAAVKETRILIQGNFAAWIAP